MAGWLRNEVISLKIWAVFNYESYVGLVYMGMLIQEK